MDILTLVYLFYLFSGEGEGEGGGGCYESIVLYFTVTAHPNVISGSKLYHFDARVLLVRIAVHNSLPNNL